MSGPHDKKRQLDDEMSRFEAEILGPNAPLRPPPPPPDMRPIIGSNTYNQVQQRLQTGDDVRPKQFQPLPQPPLPPKLLSGTIVPPITGPGPRPVMNQPQPPRYIGPAPPGMPPRGFGPPPHRPPGFIPPQIRQSMNNGMMPPNMPPMGNMMPNGNPGNVPPPRPPPGFMRPPAPPGFMGPNPPPNFVNQPPAPPPPPPPSVVSNPAVIVKPPTVISSAPKLYTAAPTMNKDKSDNKSEEKKATDTPKESSKPNEAKKQKTKHNKNNSTSENQMTHAQEMAEKVRQSLTTYIKPVQPEPQEITHTPPVETTPRTNNANTNATNTTTPTEKKKEKKSKKNLRYAGGQVWEDQSLNEWENDDFRMFAGDLGNDVTDELLNRYFNQYASFVKAKVVRDKRTNKSKGYGFISFKDPQDYIRAMKEMNGRYVGSRPIKLRKSSWKDRNIDVVQRKQKEKQLLGLK